MTEKEIIEQCRLQKESSLSAEELRLVPTSKLVCRLSVFSDEIRTFQRHEELLRSSRVHEPKVVQLMEESMELMVSDLLLASNELDRRIPVSV